MFIFEQKEIVSVTGTAAACHRRSDDKRLRPADRRGGVACALGLLILSLISTGCQRSPDAPLVSRFQVAQTAFDQADTSEEFLKAASLFQEIQKTGIVNGGLLYNLGNAYMKAERRGRAIACYRQALRYRPRDPYVKANLQFALGSGAPLRGRRKILDFVLFWQDWIGYSTKFQLTASVGVLALLAGLAGRFLAGGRLFNSLAWVSLVVTLILAGSAGYDWFRFEWVERGVIVSEQVEARKGNSESYAPAFNQPLAEGTEFRLLESRGDWRRIHIEGSGEGWIENQWAVIY